MILFCRGTRTNGDAGSHDVDNQVVANLEVHVGASQALAFIRVVIWVFTASLQSVGFWVDV